MQSTTGWPDLRRAPARDETLEALAECELVADAGNSCDHGRAAADELAPQPRHQRIDGTDVDLGLAVADDLDQIVAAERPAVGADQRREQVEFGARQRHRLAIGAEQLAPRQIDDPVAEG